MPEVPKIVHQRLRATTPAQDTLLQTHPEADVLTAFAEQALPASEREGVLQHLALCTDCREVVRFALPAAGATTHPVEEESEVAVSAAGHRSSERKRRFAWSSLGWAQLRWATLAAGIAVAVLVMRPALERIGKPHAPANSAANQTAPAPASQIASGAIPADSLAAKSAVESKAKSPAESAAKTVESETGAAGGKSGFLSHPARATPVPEPQSAMQLASNMPAGNSMKQRGGAMSKDSVSPGRAGAETYDSRAQDTLSKSESDKPALGKSNETVEVTASAPVETASSDSSATVQTESAELQPAPAIEKAKPALDDKAVKESSSRPSQEMSAAPMMARPQAEVMVKRRDEMPAMKPAASPAMLKKQAANWTIKDGVLQHSLDGGQSWQTAARADHALLCYANRGQEIWAGGQAGTLLHSIDNGATWSAIAVSFKGQRLSSAVSHIDVSGPSEIVLSTVNRETWSSVDGGKTWEKK